MEFLAFFKIKWVIEIRTHVLHWKGLLTLWSISVRSMETLERFSGFLPWVASYIQERKFSAIITLICSSGVLSKHIFYILYSLVDARNLILFYFIFSETVHLMKFHSVVHKVQNLDQGQHVYLPQCFPM